MFKKMFGTAVSVAIFVSAFAVDAQAHELESNRATLVLREKNHISVTLVINMTDLLYDVMAPALPVADFLSHFAAMPASEFRQKFLDVQAHVEGDTRMMLSNGKKLSLTQWRWPSAEVVQSNLRESAMHMAVEPHAHVVESPVEVRAEVTSNEDLSVVGFSPAKALESVLVVYYKPKQAWAGKSNQTLHVQF